MTDTPTDVAEPTGGETPPVEPQNPDPQNADTPQEPTSDGDTPPEPKPDADPQDSDKSGTEDEPAPFEISSPEGMNLNDGTIAKLTEVAQEQGLTDKQTQSLLDAAAASLNEANSDFEKATLKAWSDEVANDPQLGGASLEENMAIRDKAVEAFGDEGLREMLNEGPLPLGKEPTMFAFLVKIGKAISDDKAVNTGVNGKPGPKPITGDVFQDTDKAVAAMYPDQAKQK